ncbi:MAG: FAD-dependent oxidoreductase [Lachnospiraceae bacterium]|nr:FAD-dependent oxidoreductase [Lachnospiraceae bacterium]
MQEKYKILFTPMKIGKTELKNRYILCAMEGANLIESQHGFAFNENCREYMLERAANEVALIIPGCVFVQSVVNGQWLYEREDLFYGPVKELMEEIHRYGAKLFLQLGAGTGRSTAAAPEFQALCKDPIKKEMAKKAGFDMDRILQAPSAGLPDVWDPEMKTSEMTVEAIHEMVEAYGRTALLCQKAGIDGIEIHAVHEGYLLDQFTMNCTNHRKDAYGGSLENRFRFVTEIIQSIKKYCGPDYPVSVRYSVESKMRGFNQAAVPGEEYQEFGRDREESIRAARLLEAAGADLLDADNGTYDSWFWAHPPVYMPLACNLDSAEFIKKYVNIPVACAGRMEEPDIAAAAVAEGKIDFVGVARQFLCDGEYLTKIKEDRIDEIRPCIACHNGCFAMYRYKGVATGVPDGPMGRCALNPATFQEEEYRLRPAEEKKRVAVIGGGIGGMEAARVCALRGHEVTLYEKTGILGGVFIAAAAPSFKEKDRMLLNWYRRQMELLSVTVKMGVKIEKEDMASLDADEIIIATGAVPRRLKVAGADRAHVMEAIEYLNKEKEAGERVAVAGGGLTGCEIAYELALQGKKPFIIEMQDDILKVKNLSAANSNLLRELIRRYEIPVFLNSSLLEIGENSVKISGEEGEKEIAADSVVLSVGYIPGTELGEESSRVHIIGDACQVGNLMHVIWRANQVALHI